MKTHAIHSAVSAIVLGVITLSSSITSVQAGVTMSSPTLPPIGNDINSLPTGYLTATEVHAMFSGPGLAVILKQVIHQPFALLERLPQPDGSEIETFQSTLDGLFSVNGSPFAPFHAEGPVMTRVGYPSGGGGPLGTFPTEMLSLNLIGAGAMIRESPTLTSQGVTSVQAVTGGFQIDSFFDVFTELSVDGGMTWLPAAGPAHVELNVVPEPGTAVLLGFGALGLFGSRRRRE